MRTLTAIIGMRRKQADASAFIGRAMPELLEEVASQITRRAINEGHVRPEEADAFKGEVTNELHNRQYRASVNTGSPGSYPSAAAQLAVGTAGTVGLNRLFHRFSATPPPKMSWGEAAKSTISPAFLPMAGAFEALNLATAPKRDPLFQSGQRSYLSSLSEGIGGAVENFGKTQEDIRNRYGLLGMPLQALGGITSPITGLAYAGKSLKDSLLGKEGADVVKRAESAIHRALQCES